ncbi:Immunoglobulin-binding protein 1 [Strongyloides ratti]|uniref:Immunoglobulin-binding protein 1 n=1 Tax=Strongyloides ratti TaxID=34506 RepID=A0A090LEP5_STRRB|nr:Immunoglobulin-binding protein 1 [Strongyloides ratti]CEF66010.1 Immunoglobulin-binding protein 1 [Strongyloides ratti]
MEKTGDFSVREVFQKYRDLILKGDGSFSDKQDFLENSIVEMKKLKDNLEIEDIISLNDQIDEISATNLEMFLLPYLIGTAYYNIRATDPKKRMDVLLNVRTYLREYLEHLRIYYIIGFSLPWLRDKEEEPSDSSSISKEDKLTPSERRERILKRHQMYKNFEEKLLEFEHEASTSGGLDEVSQRNFILAKLRTFAFKAMMDLEKVDEELGILEHMLKLKRGEISEEKPKPPVKLSTYRIVRNEEQKKVFGMGYKNIPTLTVDEWYREMDTKGHFNVKQNTGTAPNTSNNDDEDDDLNEDEEESRRQKKIAWDEYTDYHRSGWGNTYNRG